MTKKTKILTALHILFAFILIISVRGVIYDIRYQLEESAYIMTHQKEDLNKGEVVEGLNEELGLNYEFFNYEWVCGKHHSDFQQWLTYSILKFDDDGFLDQVRKSNQWSRQRSDKCDKIVKTAIQIAFEDSGIELELSDNLYWYHVDTAPDDITEESGYNALYDADQRILYYTHHWACN